MWIPICTASPAFEEALRYGGTEGPDLTRYLVVCGVMLLVIAGLALGFRRLTSGALRVRASRRSLQVVDVLPLGGKQKLAVVRCYDRTFVLGLGDKEIATVAELDTAAIAAEAPAPPAQAPDRAAFARSLKNVRAALAQRTARPAAAELIPQPAPTPAPATRSLEGLLG